MPTDPERLAQELALLHDLHEGSDPLLASVSVAIYLEDAADLVFSDAEIDAGLVGPAAAARGTRDGGLGT